MENFQEKKGAVEAPAAVAAAKGLSEQSSKKATKMVENADKDIAKCNQTAARLLAEPGLKEFVAAPVLGHINAHHVLGVCATGWEYFEGRRLGCLRDFTKVPKAFLFLSAAGYRKRREREGERERERENNRKRARERSRLSRCRPRCWWRLATLRRRERRSS